MESVGRVLQETIEKNDIFPPFAKYDGWTSFFGGVPVSQMGLLKVACRQKIVPSAVSMPGLVNDTN